MIEAFIECVSEAGIEKATYRAVAQRAQVGLGTVQHYFPNKSAMINEALLVQHRALRERNEGTDSAAQPSDLAEAIKRRFARMLYLTEDERRMFSFYLEYWAHASRDPELRKFHREWWKQLEADVRDELAAGLIDDGSGPAANAADIAATLIALIYGLNANGALHAAQYPPSRVLQILDTVTDALLDGARRPAPAQARPHP
ncbi:MAG: TetR/AcrR family transcriptional regulator [Dehalococcoidia bacterium]